MSNKYFNKGFWIPSKVFFYLVMTSFIVFSLAVAYLIKSIIPTTSADAISETDDILEE